jgi:integral membrane sensor domain MASE1
MSHSARHTRRKRSSSAAFAKFTLIQEALLVALAQVQEQEQLPQQEQRQAHKVTQAEMDMVIHHFLIVQVAVVVEQVLLAVMLQVLV